MTTRLNPYLNLATTTREAMEFYRSVFGGELSLSTFADFHASEEPTEQHKIMHGQLDVGPGMVLMGADTPNGMEYSGQRGVSVSLSGGPEDAERLRGWWDALSGSGKVVLPLDQAPWGDSFGMCVDGFGTQWMVNIAGAAQA